MTRLAPLVAVALLAAPAPARGWGEGGHRIVATIAEDRAGPAARRLIREILGSRPMSDRAVAMWADDVRDRRTGPRHYVNIPLSAERYVAARDCTSAGCAVSAIDAAAARLVGADDSVELADSLRWLVHLVGDLHQPMHAGEARDRGGNDTWVRLGKRRQPLSLHRLWDVEVLDPLLPRGDPLRVARALAAAMAPADVAAWGAELSPAAWADESHRLAKVIYAELGALPADGDRILLPAGYAESQRPRTAEALSKAGVRLAALLDRIAAARAARRGGP